MRRSGSTLQYQLVAAIVEFSRVGKRVGFVRPDEFERLRAEHGVGGGLLVVKSHRFVFESEALCINGSGVVFYVYRDLRDVAVSIANKERKSVDRIIESGELDECLMEFQHWTGIPGALVFKYEDMVNDLSKTVAAIAEHLKISLTPLQCNALATDHELDRQRWRINSLRQNLEAGGLASGYDATSLLHHNHIHSGAIEQWRTQLSADQAAEIERRYGDWLVRQGYALGAARTAPKTPQKAPGRALSCRLRQWLISASKLR